MNEEKTWEQHLALYREADSLYRAGDLRSARRMFALALVHAPHDADTLWALGSCASELGKPRLAERYFRRARVRSEWKRRGDILYNIANSLFDQRRFQAALQLYVRVPRRSDAFVLARRNALAARRKLANPSFERTPCGAAQVKR